MIVAELVLWLLRILVFKGLRFALYGAEKKETINKTIQISKEKQSFFCQVTLLNCKEVTN